MGNQLSGKNVARYLRKLKIQNDSILLIQSRSPLADNENMEALVQGLKVLGLTRVVVGIVEDINDIRVVSEADMNNAGWYHINTLKGMLNKAKAAEEKNEESIETS
jgi:hypothetical protein